jgi:thymidylate synthase (FAD)
MKTTSTYGATLIDHMGSDLTVVNAARVSFDKESDWAELRTEQRVHYDGLGWMDLPDEAILKEPDVRLISYLARNGHWTPFAHPQLSFRVCAPIFVARQLQKHQIGLAWNEVSRRYVDSEPVIYVPEVWRKRPDGSVKQGSSDDIFDLNNLDCTVPLPLPVARQCVRTYNAMIEAGVCPEQARMVLPQSMMTEWVWTGSLAAFARVCNQRLDAHAQRECRPVAEAIAKALEDHFPVSWEALKNTPKEPNEPTRTA